MKKLFMAIAVMAILMLPFTSFAMTSMEEGDLSTVTGQSGVSINLDVLIDVHADAISWGDSDGIDTTFQGNTNGGWVGLTGLDVTGLRAQLRHDHNALEYVYNNQAMALMPYVSAYIDYLITSGVPGVVALAQADWLAYYATNSTDILSGGTVGSVSFANFVPFLQGGGDATADGLAAFGIISGAAGYTEAQINYILGTIRPLTIDVATGVAHGSATYVRIGTGSIGIELASLTADVKLGTAKTLDTTDGATFSKLGSLYVGDLHAYFNGLSYIDIYNDRASGQGVTIYTSVALDSVGIGTLAWGDDDGFNNSDAWTAALDGDTTGNTELDGWVGLKDLTISAATPGGSGLTVTGAIAIDVATASTAKTYVNIGFGSGLVVGLGTMTADVKVGPTKELGDDASTLGTLYLSALNMTVTGDVQIYAHVDGTEGVTIKLDDLGLAISTFTVAWGDKDGLGASDLDTNGNQMIAGWVAGTTAGYVGLKAVTLSGLSVAGEITIDVATTTSAATVMGADRTFVNIGLDNLAVTLNSFTATAALGSTGALTTGATTQELGKIYMGATNGAATIISVNGDIQIFAHDGSTGVELYLDNLNVDISTPLTVSWGDTDGVNGDSAGYVGLKSLTITDLAVNGLVSIDVATINPSGSTLGQYEFMYSLYSTHNLSTSFVHLAFGNPAVLAALQAGEPVAGITGGVLNPAVLGISIASLEAKVVLGNNADLYTGNAHTMGSLYVGNLLAGIQGWVDIAAH